jgi:hypothetical protein
VLWFLTCQYQIKVLKQDPWPIIPLPKQVKVLHNSTCKGLAKQPLHHVQGCQMADQKFPIWVNFGGSCDGTTWYILWPFGLFFNYWVHFVVIWYTHYMVFWYRFPVLVCGFKKIWQPWGWLHAQLPEEDIALILLFLTFNDRLANMTFALLILERNKSH